MSVAESPPPTPTPSSSIATAARRFGDAYPAISGVWRVRAAGALLLLTIAVYTPWMLSSLNGEVPLLAWSFAAASLFTVATSTLSVINAWTRRVPEPRPLALSAATPHVAVLLPTCGEPVGMILRTLQSILDQDWPRDRLTIIVSDDGHDPQLKTAVLAMGADYHEPPDRWAPGRDGAAKAGNLNSVWALVQAEYPWVDYVETRDADDEVGSNGFLRQVVGQLEHDPRLAFVQTIKEAQVSAKDPFNNLEAMFYRGQMLSRNAANAVFPCGSGLVWRREALADIDGFPTWNLVEDLQSGVEALRRGWHGLYLPIVGAVGQHAPEDLPNFYKQRGTWAIDTVRLVVWGRMDGLSWRQRLHFYEQASFYFNGFTALVYIPCLFASLLGWLPLAADSLAYLGHMVPLAFATELWLIAYSRPYADRRGKQREPIRALWRVRVMWAGMAPVYMRACVKAVLGGRRRKPVYVVTRKHDDLRWHWRSAAPHTLLTVAVLAVFAYALGADTIPNVGVLAGASYFGAMNVVLLSGFVTRSWHGITGIGRWAAQAPAPALAEAAEPELSPAG